MDALEERGCLADPACSFNATMPLQRPLITGGLERWGLWQSAAHPGCLLAEYLCMGSKNNRAEYGISQRITAAIDGSSSANRLLGAG